MTVQQPPDGALVIEYEPKEETARQVARIELAGARAAVARYYGIHVCVVDDCGRVLVLSVEDFNLVHEARI